MSIGEEAERARADALKDMEDEGMDDVLKEAFIRDMKLQFSSSFLVKNERTHDLEHGLAKQIAENTDEALGKTYRELCEQFPAEDGWSSPSIIVDDQPSVIMPGTDVPLCVSRGECPTCGDPRGACEDPDACIQNPGPCDTSILPLTSSHV